MMRLFTGFVKVTGWPAQFCCFRTKTYYESKKEQSRHVKGPAIIICNHTSVFDFAVLMFVFFTSQLRTMMAELLFDHKFPPFFLKGLGGIYVDRNSHNFDFIAESLEILKAGGKVLVFPESRIPRPEEARPLPFKTLVAYLAHESGAPVIPCYTNGCYFQKKRARVIIGKPIHVEELWKEGLSEKENISAITETFRKRIIALGKLLAEKQELERYTRTGRYLLYDFAKATAALPLLLWYRPKRIYAGNAKVACPKGGVLYLSNHVSLDDPVVMMVAVWQRRMHIMAMQELFDRKFLGWLLTQFRAIPVDRQNFKMSSFREVEQLLKADKAVGLFPEGGINTNTATVNPFKSGMILMAARGGAPIVPMYIQKRKSRLSRQVIAIGEPVDIRGLYGSMPSMANVQAATELLHSRELDLMHLCKEDIDHAG